MTDKLNEKPFHAQGRLGIAGESLLIKPGFYCNSARKYESVRITTKDKCTETETKEQAQWSLQIAFALSFNFKVSVWTRLPAPVALIVARVLDSLLKTSLQQ